MKFLQNAVQAGLKMHEQLERLNKERTKQGF